MLSFTEGWSFKTFRLTNLFFYLIGYRGPTSQPKKRNNLNWVHYLRKNSDVKILDVLFQKVNFRTFFFSHVDQISDKYFGNFPETLLKQINAYNTWIRLGKRAKKDSFSVPLRVYRYNDEKITQILSNSYVFQRVSYLEFAPYKSFGAQKTVRNFLQVMYISKSLTNHSCIFQNHSPSLNSAPGCDWQSAKTLKCRTTDK